MAQKQRRRLRSSTVVLGGMGVVAATLTSCSSEPDRRCVDTDSYEYANGYRIVADSNCSSYTSGSDWYYDADVEDGWAEDGTFDREEAVDRNGFGCSGSGGG
ncbi:hypothetical protein [Streptomyces sp. NPDC002644]|jgi:hypothetical protein